jgi:hypothetical protein
MNRARTWPTDTRHFFASTGAFASIPCVALVTAPFARQAAAPGRVTLLPGRTGASEWPTGASTLASCEDHGALRGPRARASVGRAGADGGWSNAELRSSGTFGATLL